MGTLTKVVPRPEPPGVLYWFFRAMVCSLVAPLLGILIGIVALFAGVWLGEFAALGILVLFLVDLFSRLVRARRQTSVQAAMIGLADPDLDAWS